jgi:hypothetical protein
VSLSTTSAAAWMTDDLREHADRGSGGHRITAGDPDLGVIGPVDVAQELGGEA